MTKIVAVSDYWVSYFRMLYGNTTKFVPAINTKFSDDEMLFSYAIAKFQDLIRL